MKYKKVCHKKKVTAQTGLCGKCFGLLGQFEQIWLLVGPQP